MELNMGLQDSDVNVSNKNYEKEIPRTSDSQHKRERVRDLDFRGTSDLLLACDINSSNETEIEELPITPGRQIKRASGHFFDWDVEASGIENENKRMKMEFNSSCDIESYSVDINLECSTKHKDPIKDSLSKDMCEIPSCVENVDRENTMKSVNGNELGELQVPLNNIGTNMPNHVSKQRNSGMAESSQLNIVDASDDVMQDEGSVLNLKEFDVLDETDGDEDLEADSEDTDYPSDNEVDAMLDEGLKRNNVANEIQEKEVTDPKEYTERTKVLLVEKVTDPFEVLPSGWVAVPHESGMPIYLHRPTRVCTVTKPYFLGTGSARKHSVPVSSVPCLEYRRAMEEETKKTKEPADANNDPVLQINGLGIPFAKVESVQENEVNRQLTPIQWREYCNKLFQFKSIQVVRFNSWPARRKYHKQSRSGMQRPTLPKDTKLITCPVLKAGTKSGQAKGWMMNPAGKSYVCILHEYMQRVLNSQPVYVFKELEHTAKPYMATVHIENIQYGTGMGKSKKLAKHNAARATLEILIPDFKHKLAEDDSANTGNSTKTDLSFFDDIKIEDPRVTELCMKTTEPLPHTVLLTCLQRNFGMGETNIKYETKSLRHSKNEFTMTLGTHQATVICQNKRDGKQKASQAILQVLHPHITSWGSLLRLYGNTSIKSVKEKKLEEQKITYLQNRGTTHGPNYAILQKLVEEIRKAKELKNAVKCIGKFVPPDDVNLPQASSADLDNVKL